MPINTILYDRYPVTVLSVSGTTRFLARLLACDHRKLPVGQAVRAVMLNASAGVIDTVVLARVTQDDYRIILSGDGADAREAWIRQVSAAFDAEVLSSKQLACDFLGTMPIDGVELKKGSYQEMSGIGFVNLGWKKTVFGPKENIEALCENLVKAGAKKGAEGGMDALRILAREPALGLEYDESTSPLECGLEDAIDFEDKSRVFIGRALCEEFRNSGKYERLHLVAFDVAFDPNALTQIPMVVVGEYGFEVSSLVRVPEMNLTAALVRLPHEVKVGDHLGAIVETEPACGCDGCLVVAPQS